MSFGAVQSAMTTIKNNRKLLSKRKKLKNRLSGNEKEGLEFKSPNATSSQLKRIREKMKYEQRRTRKKQIIVLVVLMSIIISVFAYYL